MARCASHERRCNTREIRETLRTFGQANEEDAPCDPLGLFCPLVPGWLLAATALSAEPAVPETRAPGLLKRMTLEMYVPDWRHLRDPSAMNAICTYEASRGTDRRVYRYETVPRIVREGRLSPALSPHPFTQIAGAATSYPPQAP